MSGSGDRLPSELLSDLGAHFVATPTDRWAQVYRQLVGRQPVARERRDGLGGDARRRPPPTGMKERNDPGWMRDEYRHTVRYAYREPDSLFGGDMPIGLAPAEPSFPAAGVHEHPGAMNLADGDEAPGDVSDLVLHSGPAAHDLVYRIVSGEAEGARFTGRSERANSPTVEVGDYFLGNLTHGYCRRSSTRVIAAPSLLRRSSMRS